MPSEVPQHETPTTIALIGATHTAEQIASRALLAGLNVIIDDISDARLQATSINLRNVGAQDSRAPVPQDRSDLPRPDFSSSASPSSNLLLTQSIESAIRNADFLIDTLPDDLEVKLELFTLFDKFAKPNAIFITTGAIPIDDLAGITFCPDRCVAVRIVGVTSSSAQTFGLIPSKQTSANTLATCTDLFAQILRYPLQTVPT